MATEDDDKCPKCGEECFRDEVDVGVGTIYGPWGCPGCGWSSDPEYDRSEGESKAQRENPDWYVDSTGGMIRKSALKENVARFGLDPSVIDEVFGPEGTTNGNDSAESADTNTPL